MRSCNYLVTVLLVAVLMLGAASAAVAGAQYMGQIPAAVQDKSCNLCHTANMPALNAPGQAWVDAGKDWNVFTGTAQPAADAEKGLPETGGNPYIYVGIGMVMFMSGLLMGKRRADQE
jgi:LPXTG-motif cell wall-anchored protein